MDYNVKVVLVMIQLSENLKYQGLNPSVIDICLESFNTKTGLSSKHIIYCCYGCVVVGVHEYYTSAKYPRPNCNQLLESSKKRSKFCRHCQAYFDRDTVGSDNIAQILLAQLTSQTRPAK
ncbi:hypothetical protein FBU30_003577 [Linnemannia zychae]|nr:hypothetical protein FBU30_003577 [Linnemannia zychae]